MLHQGSFWLNIMKNLFSERVVRYWNKWCRVVMKTQSLEVFKKRVDVTMSDMVQDSHRHGLMVGLDDLIGLFYLNDSTVLFYDSMSRQLLNISQVGDSINSPGNLFIMLCHSPSIELLPNVHREHLVFQFVRVVLAVGSTEESLALSSLYSNLSHFRY